MNGPWLILVKHSLPAIDLALPPPTWPLSAEGRARCRPLAGWLAQYHPTVVVASLEPKAQETGELVARRLDLPSATAPGLHEHERRDLGWLDRAEFDRRMAGFFARPAERVLGQESANAAAARFSLAVGLVLENWPEQTIALVAHGTVISLLLAQVLALPAFPLWRSLGLPSAIAFPRAVLASLLPASPARGARPA